MKPFAALILCFALICCSNNSDEPISTTDEEIIQEDNGDTDSEPQQSLYFPPVGSNDWEIESPEDIGWNETAITELLTFLEEKNTKAFMILKDGRIVLENYFNGGSQFESNPWFSAGKTLTAFVTGMAQDSGYLDLSDATSDYLGEGWTSMPLTQESAISLKDQITMTTGADYTVANTNCTLPECLFYLNDPGSFWYYHNAMYTLIQPALNAAIPEGFDTYFEQNLKTTIGMDGAWIDFKFPRVYFSTARSMARFGLLCLNEGNWDGNQLVSESYFSAMTQTSQELNSAYGYLWWLNGKDQYRLPGSTLEFDGALIPDAPHDLIAGLGANDQKLYVVPSKGLVVIRMGEAAGEPTGGPSGFDNLLWQKINAVID
ncbi:serine hydrolase [Gilvibacter sp.]|uniref:serine hydrolase domain-containing protein n=1 Tax=Gilvibacter sp. TaxID=2729997 RepID=UPI0025BB553D|nr:serine hydrolase [Gilvibacter sp.]NQX76491.1 serine hydrolase [Gilvibacter sp.]